MKFGAVPFSSFKENIKSFWVSSSWKIDCDLGLK